MRSSEVFPLEACLREFLLYCLDKLIYEVEVSLAGNPFMAPAKVLGILQPCGVVRPNI